jgi:Domain of unknown function (DUF4352)
MFSAFSLRGIVAHVTGRTISALARIGLLVVLGSGLFGCGPKGGVPSNSNQTPTTRQTGSLDSGAPNASDAVPASSPARTEFKTGEAVPAGYFGYKVFGSWFSNHLQANAKTVSAENYLYVDLAVVNTDKKERSVAPLRLVDEAGKEYPLSQKSESAGRSVGELEKLGPNVSKRVLAIFAVPKGRQYKLKIEGFSASEAMTITLSPAATPPKP